MTTQTTMTVIVTALTLMGFAGVALAECGNYRAANQTAQKPILPDEKTAGS